MRTKVSEAPPRVVRGLPGLTPGEVHGERRDGGSEWASREEIVEQRLEGEDRELCCPLRKGVFQAEGTGSARVLWSEHAEFVPGGAWRQSKVPVAERIKQPQESAGEARLAQLS